MDNCIFCKIVKGEIPSKKVYEDDKLYAFHDIKPCTPVHILVIPKAHISDLNHLNTENAINVSDILRVGSIIAKEAGLAESGYRFMINCGKDAGMEVEHLHLHILGGRKMKLGC